ncbi:MAG: PqqD family peptide modification chaperone [Pseudolabrys sp.]
MNALSLASMVIKTDGVPDAEVDSEVVILGVERNVCYGLNSVGSRVWQLLGDRIQVSDICKTLRSEYDVDASVCEGQVLALLENMRSEGLIQICDDSRGPSLNSASS